MAVAAKMKAENSPLKQSSHTNVLVTMEGDCVASSSIHQPSPRAIIAQIRLLNGPAATQRPGNV